MAGPIERFRAGRESLEGAAPGLKAVFAPRLLAERERTNQAVSALFADESALSRFAPETVDEIRWQASQPMSRQQHREFRSGLASVAQAQLEWQWQRDAAHDYTMSVANMFGAFSQVLPGTGIDAARQQGLARQLQAAQRMSALDPERAVQMAESVRVELDEMMDEARALRAEDRRRYQNEMDDLRQVHREQRNILERAVSPLVSEAARQSDDPAWANRKADKWLAASVMDAMGAQIVQNEQGRLGLSFDGVGWKNDPSMVPDLTNAQLLQLAADHLETLDMQAARDTSAMIEMLREHGFGFDANDPTRVEDIISTSYRAASDDIGERMRAMLPSGEGEATSLPQQRTTLSSLAQSGLEFLGIDEAVDTALDPVRGAVTDAIETVVDTTRQGIEYRRRLRAERMRALQSEMIP